MDWEKQKDIILQETTLEYLALAIVDREGNARYTDDRIFDLSDRGYIEKALAGEFNISPEITSRVTGEPVMMIAQPITKNDEILGAIIARIDPEFLTNFLTSEDSKLYNIYYVLDQQGNVILHSDKLFQSRRVNFLNFDEKSYGFNGLKEIIRDSYKVNDGFGNYKKDNKRVVIGYSTIKALDWKFFVGFYEESILSTLREIDLIFMSIASVLLIFTVIIAWFISKSLTKPVIELSNLFMRASKGELTVRSTYNKEDELGEASRSFNIMMKQMQKLTYFDPVTDLPNQQVFYRDLKEKIYNNDVSKIIMIIQISDFSRINEIHGYQVGDEILKVIADRILHSIDLETNVYRGKGDQFIVLFEKENNIRAIGQKIINEINLPINHNNNLIIINARIGISKYPKDGIKIDNLIKKAVFASNYLKKKGTDNHIQIFESRLYNKDLEIQETIKKISDALDNNQMHLVYQPIYRLQDMVLSGTEALIRWNDINRGSISPGEFIPIAERNGLIKKLDHWVIKSVLKQLKSWQKEDKSMVTCSINIAAETFENDNFENFLMNETLKTKIDPNLIQIELTERTILKDIDGSIRKFSRLREKGFKIAIDDFGTGYSSLSYLVKLPIDHLKIDQSFIMNISNGQESKVIVSTLINMAKELNIAVVAEGIETQEELNYLLDLDCDKGQGYYLDIPLSVNEISKLF
jgi:diguanylate cyclase (GGDEF)-like protein